jgi:hypothetical protein
MRLPAPLSWQAASLAAALCCAALPSHAQQELSVKVKSAYIVHLAQFVDWPLDNNSTLRVCVTGDHDISTLLEQMNGKALKGRTVQVIPEPLKDLSACQVLFIGKYQSNPEGLLQQVRGKPVLSVGDLKHFTLDGGLFGFSEDAGRIRLEVNPQAIEASGLKVSAKLLEVARIARP